MCITVDGDPAEELAVYSAMTLWYWHGCAPLSAPSLDGSQPMSELHAHRPEHDADCVLSQL
jgi:hypothetical protein